MGKTRFTLITKANCPWCYRAKQELAIRNYDYTEKLLGKDITTQEFKACYPDQKRVPLVLIQDDQDSPRRVLGSYNELMEFLENGNGAVTAKSEDTDGNKKDDYHAP